MAKILSIETATTNCSVSLSETGKLVVLQEDQGKNYSHAERLHVYIQQAMTDSGWKLSDLDGIAVSKGPGSYTGLRIGVSAAKGLCYAADLPLISIPTLQSLAVQLRNTAEVIVPMLDARRMEVYSAVYNGQGEELRSTDAEILDEYSFSDLLKAGRVSFIGNGVAKWQQLCHHVNASFHPEILPSAKEMAALAYEKWKAQQFEDVAYFEPYYLKDFIAGKKSS